MKAHTRVPVAGRPLARLPQSHIAPTLAAKMAESREISMFEIADNVNPVKVG
jgi:hypothetical protein